MGTPSFRNPFVTIAHHWSIVWGRTDGSTQPRTEKVRRWRPGPRIFLSPFAVIWRLMHWPRRHHKLHHQRSSDKKNKASQSLQHFPTIKRLCLINGRHLVCSRRAPRSTSLAPEMPPPPLIGLFHRASQQPWQLQPWLSLACFHYKPWHLISLREMGSERWGTRVAKPFSSIFDDALSSSRWCEKCLRVPAPQSSCFCPFCLLLKTKRSGCLSLCQRSIPDAWN